MASVAKPRVKTQGRTCVCYYLLLLLIIKHFHFFFWYFVFYCIFARIFHSEELHIRKAFTYRDVHLHTENHFVEGMWFYNICSERTNWHSMREAISGPGGGKLFDWWTTLGFELWQRGPDQ